METDFAFLDSGTGGVPYMLDLKGKSPGSTCVYLGDTANFPYGEKSAAQVAECAERAVRRIVSLWNPKVLVVACNTISVGALSSLRSAFPALPIVGTVPAIKMAAVKTRNGRIGLLATSATVENPYSRRLIEDFARGKQVFMRGDGALVSFVERSLFCSNHTEKLAAVAPAVEFFRTKGCDTIILGCTHFTHVADEIAEAAGDDVLVVDSRDGVANQALRVFREASAGKGGAYNAAAINGAGGVAECVPIAAAPDGGIAGGADDSGRCAAVLRGGMSFFVTRLSSEEQRREYETLCRHYGISFGGVA